MKYSKLKHELEILDINHKHELELMKMKHAQTKNEMLSKCTHKYEDGTSSTSSHGMQWDYYTKCDICGKSI